MVSFHSADKYYHLSGLELRRDCTRLGLPHKIVEMEGTENSNWDEICRRKVKFCRDMFFDYRCPILWIDADTKLLKLPKCLFGSKVDVGGYLRGFRDIREFNRAEVGRFWVPGILFFGYTARAARFLEYAASLEAESHARATDDYFWEEAWRRFPQPLATCILPPDTVSIRPEEVTENTCFLVRMSGNAREIAPLVEQHEAAIRTPRFRSLVLDAEAAQAYKAGEMEEARVLAKRSSMIDKSNKTAVLRYSDVLRATGDPATEVDILAHYISDAQMGPAVANRILGAKRRARVPAAEIRNWLEEIARDESMSASGLAKSRLFLMDLDERAAVQGYKAPDRVKLWWMETPYPGNFGDMLSPYVIEKITGVPPLFAARGERLLAVGSTVKFAEAGVTVWGTGTPRASDKVSPEANFLAVRGPLTRELIRRNGGTCPDVYGDPALLLPMIYAPRRRPSYKLGLVRHTIHSEIPVHCEEVKEISVFRCGYREIEGFIDEIADCERILSSSLHGLIVANAYGVPARWCTFSGAPEQIKGDGTKFADYWLSAGIPIQEVLDLSGRVIDPKLASEVDETVDLKINSGRLLDVFPQEWIRAPQLLRG